MKDTSVAVQIQTNTKITPKYFGVNIEDVSRVFEILRSKLYSNKITSIIREYACNAYDAHVEAGIPDVPIEITLPGLFDLTFTVKDFGPGLSEKEVYETYVMYGTSTKRNTNAQTGQFGLGSKSAFCYTDSFIIESRFNGRQSIYSAFIDETKVGAIVKVGESPCTDTGITIKIPCKHSDLNSFLAEAKALRFFATPPKVSPPIATLEYVINRPNYAIVERHGISGPMVLMGNVAYPLNHPSFSRYGDPYNWIPNEIIFKLEIGEVSVSASREALEYDDNTILTIKAKIEDVKKTLKKDFTDDIAKESTKLSKLLKITSLAKDNQLFRSLFNTRGGGHYAEADNSLRSINLHGENFVIARYTLYNSPPGGIVYVSRNRYLTNSSVPEDLPLFGRKSTKKLDFEANENTKFIEVDECNYKSARIATLDLRHSLVFKIVKESERQDFYNTLGIIPEMVTKLSSIQYVATKKQNSASSKTLDVEVYELKGDGHCIGYPGNAWVPTQKRISAISGSFILLRSFVSAYSSNGDALSGIRSKYNMVKAQVPAIYGIKEKYRDVALANKNLEEVCITLKRLIDKEVTKINLPNIRAASQIKSYYESTLSLLKRESKNPKVLSFINLVLKFADQKIVEKYYGIECDAAADLDFEVDQIEIAYPLLRSYNNHERYIHLEDFAAGHRKENV